YNTCNLTNDVFHLVVLQDDYLYDNKLNFHYEIFYILYDLPLIDKLIFYNNYNMILIHIVKNLILFLNFVQLNPFPLLFSLNFYFLLLIEYFLLLIFFLFF